MTSPLKHRVEVSVLDVPYAQRLILAAIDLLHAVKSAETVLAREGCDWVMDAANRMDTIIDERYELSPGDECDCADC